jgi:hypothetical protein
MRFDPEENQNEEDILHEVIIVSSQNRFDDLAWSREVFRFLKSATRSGFIKKLRVEEYDAFSSEQRSNIVSVLEGLYLCPRASWDNRLYRIYYCNRSGWQCFSQQIPPMDSRGWIKRGHDAESGEQVSQKWERRQEE